MAAVVAQEEQPISRTYQYRKVMKPMLERKRRARINRCLDELKELLVGALQAEGESVSRLEKADVLELTVRHLHKLRRSQQISESSAGERFRAGFVHCANEVSKYITTLTKTNGPAPVDMTVSSRLVGHLEQCINHLESSAQIHHQMMQQQQHMPHSSPPQMSPVAGYSTPVVPVSLINSPTGAASNGHGLNILTTYTPPSSPINSPNQNNNAHHPNAKLYAYIPGSTGSQSSPASSVSSAGSLSPIPPAHINHAFAAHLASAMNAGLQPLSLCTKSPNPDEPLNLSENVWRPW
ncbi:unnamed protein product [Orchesella dallaii]|uniref:Enhancer of split mgamma protein n=1 Tax=Orchesella dallaii TaxID=48710 RepID=A0ABP1QA64_9HEXA